MEVGTKVFAASGWQRVGLERGMRGEVVKVWADGSLHVKWAELAGSYPQGVWHHTHHPGRMFKAIIPAADS